MQTHSNEVGSCLRCRQSSGTPARGHSLVELLIVIGIIAVVVGMIAGTFFKVYRVIESWK